MQRLLIEITSDITDRANKNPMNHLVRLQTTLLIFLWPILSYSQQDLKGTISDNQGHPLPYATIYNLNNLTGTASSENGTFLLKSANLGDSLTCSYIGFKEQVIVVSSFDKLEIILQKSVTMMDEISITADDDYLYEWVARIRKKRKTTQKTAKTYYFLQSTIDEQTTEVLESYNNGYYSNLNADLLSIKKGRVGIDSVDGRYFLSTSTSLAMLRHNIWDRKSPFPNNPLNYKKRRLKKLYKLHLDSRYKSDNNLITVIRFEPLNEDKDLFSGVVAFDDQYRLRKIELEIQETKTHPFESFGGITLQTMDIRLTKTFQLIDQKPFLDHIDFDYKIDYLDRGQTPVAVKTKAYIKAYSYEETFSTPIFRFSNHIHRDYRDMTAIPYDSIFWEQIDEFRLFEKQEFASEFISKNKVENSLLPPSASINNNSLESPYLNWEPMRFMIVELPQEELEKAARDHPYVGDRYYFDFKMYLDSYTLRDSTYIQSAAILDPVRTRYELKITKLDHEWMNMYFDLLEIERRRMDRNLRMLPKPVTREQLENEHRSARSEFIKLANVFREDTKRGRDFYGMEKWKKSIEEELLSLQ